MSVQISAMSACSKNPSEENDKGNGTTASGETLSVELIDPYYKVLPQSGLSVKGSNTAYAACGEYAVFQAVIHKDSYYDFQAEDIDFINEDGTSVLTSEAGWIGYVGCTDVFAKPGDFKLTSPDGKYPDPVFDEYTAEYSDSELQPVWITVWIPEGTPAGTYKGTLEIKAEGFRKSASAKIGLAVEVYPVTVPKPTLQLSNWVIERSYQFSYLNMMQDVPRYYPMFWSFVKQLADICARHRINVHFVYYPFDWIKVDVDESGTYTFDFANLKKEIEIYEAAGALDRLELNRYAFKEKLATGGNGIGMIVPEKGSDGQMTQNYYPVSHEKTKNFYSQYLPALKTFLNENGWLDKYIQHVYDEPLGGNMSTYKSIRNLIKEYIPEAKIMDATYNINGLAGSVDIWCPLLDTFHKNYDYLIGQTQDGNSELWFYTMKNPQGNYANRFIEKPLIETRILHWLNYKYKATGYLYWSFNDYWFPDVFAETAYIDDSCPGGDTYIVYPGYQKYYPSIRLYAMSAGAADYELLKMLEQRNPDKANSIVGSIVLDFDEYEHDLSIFSNARKQILESLSE